MTRVKRGVPAQRKHRKILKKTKGFKGLPRKRIKQAKTALYKAGQNAYVGRKLKKRDMRRIWITRINAGVKPEGLNYSRLIYGLLKAKVAIDRKMLAELAANNPAAFKQVVEVAKKAL